MLYSYNLETTVFVINYKQHNKIFLILSLQASLMKQDLTLMKQLLTLNDTIEDIKSQRLYGSSKESLASSRDLSASDWSVSDTDMYIQDDDDEDDVFTECPIFKLKAKQDFSSKITDSIACDRTEGSDVIVTPVL